MDNLWSVLAQTLALSVAAAVLLAAKRLFLDKLSPRWQYGVWAILALRALLPAGLLGRTLVPGGRAVLEAARLQVELPLSSVLTDPYGVTEVLAPVPLFPRGLPVPGSITDVFFYVYAAGVLLLALWFFRSYTRLRAAIRRGLSPAPEVLAQVEGVAARYGLKAPRRVVVLPGLESAFVCGPLRPVLALPDRPVDDKVLLHELLHLRHGDVWAGVGVCALRCLHWCNPLIWYCCDRIQNDCEALCDQRVLERLEGEERRAYGVILLSMADGRYARAPGTSSMANGGRNIKARIQAIARFRRYPAGMALASGCVAAVLALTCLGGVSGAAEVPGGTDRGALALAQAQLNRPTTVAGALDTYAKALLNDSPLYYAMVLPEEGREAVWKDALVPYQEVELEDSPFWTLGFHWHRPSWLAEWSVMNLLPDGAEGYTGTLFFSPLSEDNTYGIVYQQVAVRPDGDFWTVEPLGDLTVRPDPNQEGIYLCPSSEAPYTTYVAETVTLHVEVDVQLQLNVNNAIFSTSTDLPAWASTYQLDLVPHPDASFTTMRDALGLRVSQKDTGEAVDLMVDAILMAHPAAPAAALLDTPYQYTLVPGELYEGPNMELSAMPAALALTFTYNGHTYTCTAYPAEVTP
ncbi:Regulatory protein BlaR1 [Flavonifractor plautii]|uniref:M56 family metallopeptidase n=1 Tax=Flavonifractor plautii TaxID=292800 RepID=UPI0006BF900B|nr:M56 family metallopeptidase [Flavonifractor plautii]CUP87888.1 Regulatory protein BlaR1 [Flavonifractor plautii]CUQ49231.1 peptidase M56 BlaR1 [Flavonifractor plautii]